MTGYFTELFQYDFMRRAFLVILIITPLLGILGTMIVHKKMAYFSDALGHSALTGIAIGVVCGISDTNLSMVLQRRHERLRRRLRDCLHRRDTSP